MATQPSQGYRLTVPGDVLGDLDNQKPGNYTYTRDGKILAARLGFVKENAQIVNIVPLGGVYNPAPGDTVVGIVTELGPSNWMIDINAPYPAPMHVSETPWNVEFGETAEYLRAGDAILCEILFVDESRRVQVTMKGTNLNKLNGGHILEIAPSKVARVIGRAGSMVNLIKKNTDVWALIGQNGRIWLNGEPEMIKVAINAIRLIEREAHRPGLTEKVERFLAQATGRPGTTAPVEAEAN